MITLRKNFFSWLFDTTQRIYVRNFKKHKRAWNITTKQLLAMPTTSFGYHLGCFLKENNYTLIDKVERHDAYHLLTGYGTKVEDEIALQFLCFGNGKRTPYMFAALLLGALILPEYLSYYVKAYTRGKNANCFHHFEYKDILPINFEQFRATIFLESKQSQTAHTLN